MGRDLGDSREPVARGTADGPEERPLARAGSKESGAGEASKQSAQAQAVKVLPTWVLPVCASLAWVVFGSCLLVSIHGMSWIDVIYVLVQIVTTVGYGDIVPETQGQKICIVVLVLTSTLLIANIIMFAIAVIAEKANANLESAITSKEDEIRDRLEEKANKEAHCNMDEASRSRTLRAYGQSQNADESSRAVGNVMADFSLFVLCLLVGMVFFRLVEPCTCWYGLEKIEGCYEQRCANPDPDYNETMGDTKTWVDCFYMAVITMTTVGFGDKTANSEVGRLFCSAWMILGVAVTVKLCGSFSDAVTRWESSGSRKARIRAAFHENDEDGDGTLSREEFLRMYFIMNDMTTGEQFDSIMRQFDIISGRDRRVSKKEFAAYYLPDE